MAGGEALILRIVQESEEQTSEIAKKAEEEASRILEKAMVEAEKAVKSIEDKSKVKADENRRRAFTMAELESRKEILSEKQNQISEAFTEAVKQIAAIDKEEYQAILMPMLMDSIESGEEIVLVSPGDEERMDDKFIMKANEELKKQGKKGDLKLAVDTDNFGGGFILKSAQYTVNNSFDSIIKMKRDELEPEVAEILFQ